MKSSPMMGLLLGALAKGSGLYENEKEAVRRISANLREVAEKLPERRADKTESKES